MREWRTEHKVAVIGTGVAVLIAIAEIFSDYMRKHSRYAEVAGFLAVMMILVPCGHTLLVWFKNRDGSSETESPLEIIFEPLNPARRFWSMESPKDDDGKLIGIYWEHRVEIRNNGPLTLRNVEVTVERTGDMPEMPQNAFFVRNKRDTCNLQPGCREYVPVVRWPQPKRQAGMFAGPSAWEYGPIMITASADNVPATVKVFDFNYDTEQMLFERGKC